MVISGTPDWAARPASRLRAPAHAAALAGAEALGDGRLPRARQGRDRARRPGRRQAPLLERLERAQPPVLHLAPARHLRRLGPVLAVKRYAELTRNLKRALDEAPGDQEYVLGELAGLDVSKTKSTSLQEFIRKLPTSVVCGSTILSQHGYITGINPVDLATRAAATHHCPKKHVVWMTETGVGAPHAGQDKRVTAPRRAPGLPQAPPAAGPVVQGPAGHRGVPVHVPRGRHLPHRARHHRAGPRVPGAQGVAGMGREQAAGSDRPAALTRALREYLAAAAAAPGPSPWSRRGRRRSAARRGRRRRERAGERRASARAGAAACRARSARELRFGAATPLTGIAWSAGSRSGGPAIAGRLCSRSVDFQSPCTGAARCAVGAGADLLAVGDDRAPLPCQAVDVEPVGVVGGVRRVELDGGVDLAVRRRPGVGERDARLHAGRRP